MTRAVALLIPILTTACAYYNGLYNARGLVRRAESAARDGRDTAAVAAWREAAAKADTVIRRYPRSRWIDDALLVSGTSAALAGDCAHGLARLAEWERHPNAKTRGRARASIGRAACLVRRGEYDRALDTLGPLGSHRDATVRRLSAAWAARAAIATNRGDSAARFARIAASDALDAELAGAALATHPAVATRLLRQRATEWRTLSAVQPVMERLALLNRASADSIVSLAQRGRSTRVERARLSLGAGAWAERERDSGRAREHYARALRMTTDTAIMTEATARLGFLRVRGAATIEAARSSLEQADGWTSDNAALARLDTALTMISRLTSARDTSGASLFLAAEVARDRVGATLLAQRLFLRAAREYPESSLAPKALLAAAELSPDSAQAWRARVRGRYAESPYARLLDGKAASSIRLETDERLLREAWAHATAIRDSGSVATRKGHP